MYSNFIHLNTMSTLYVTVKAEGESCCYSAPFGQSPFAAYKDKVEASKEKDVELVSVHLYKEENIDPTQVYALNVLLEVVDCYEFPVYCLVETVFATKEAALEYVSDNPDDYEEEDGNPVVYCLEVL